MPDWAIDHISAVTLAVRDMAESVAFYERLGLHVSYGGPNAAFTTIDDPNNSSAPRERVRSANEPRTP